MAQAHNFRSALNGFHREDVVNFIEYMNKKHADQVNRLQGENQALQKELNALREQPVSEDLSEQLAALEAECAALKARCAELEAQAAPKANVAEEELEAYRRAERMERAAKERSRQIYNQATATLAEATSRIDTASAQVRQIAEKVTGQIAELQVAVEGSKAALLDAATTMYTICPEGEE